MHAIQILANFLMLMLCFACKTSDKSDAGVKDIAADRKATNVVLILGAGDNLREEVSRDLDRMEKLFTEDLKDQNFKVFKLNDAKKADIETAIREYAPKVGLDGTLALVFSGHGNPGYIVTADHQSYPYRDIVADIKGVRDEPIKRFVFFLNSCYSGSATSSMPDQGMRNEQQAKAFLDAVAEYNNDVQFHHPKFQTDPKRAAKFNSGRGNFLFEQFFVLTASRDNEPAFGGPNLSGSVFMVAVEKAFRELQSSKKEEATFEDLVNGVKASVASQTPTFQAFPADLVMKEKLFTSTEQAKPRVSISRDAALKAWMGEVLTGVNAHLQGCTISASELIPEPTGSFFSPTFIATTNRGISSYPVNLGTYNWLSNPDVSAKTIIQALPHFRLPECGLVQ